MKKKIVNMLLLLLLIAGSAFANKPGAINEKVNNAFKKEFALAEDVKWETARELVKITFKLNGQIMFAYYTDAGDLMAVTRNISSVQLPINLLAELKRDYNAYWISDLFEISNANGTTYYMTLEDADTTLVVRSANNIGWQTYRKTKKEAA